MLSRLWRSIEVNSNIRRLLTDLICYLIGLKLMHFNLKSEELMSLMISFGKI
jgi:hypothetical protein